MGGESFDYSIVADGAKADATNKIVEAGLERIEKMAGATGRSMDRAFDAKKTKDSTGAFLASSYALQQTKERVDRMNDAWDREESVLEKIRGPAREHEADLRAITSLYSQGKITAEEYASATTKMATAHAHGEGGGFKVEGIGGAVAGQFGELGSTFGELAGKGTLAAGSVAALGYEVVHLSDDYAKMENAAIKLADGTRATSDVLDEQLSLAGDLHTSLESTMELSDAVKDRTSDLNLTNEERLRLTKSLGDAAVLENKSMSSAADVISRVGFALESGIPAGRAMKSLMMDYPVLADVMRDHFHMSTKAIIDLANKGGLSMEDFSKAMREAGDDLDTKVGARAVGLGTKLGHMKDALFESKLGLENLADWINPGLRELERATAAVHAHTDEVKKNTDKINEQLDAIRNLEFENSELVTSINRVAAATAAGQKITDDNAKAYTDAIGKVDAYRGALINIEGALALVRSRGGDASKVLNQKDIETLRAYQDALQLVSDSGSRYGAIVGDIHKREVERTRGLADLNGALREHRITTAQYAEEIKKFQGPMSEEEKIFHEIVDPIKEANVRIKSLNDLFARGRIDVDQYTIAMTKAKDALEKATEKPFDRAASMFVDEQGGIPKFEGPSAKALKAADDSVERTHLNAMVAGTQATEKFAEESRELDAAERNHVITSGEHATMLDRLRARYDDVRTAGDEWQRALEQAREKLDAGQYSADQYARAVAKVSAQYDHSFGQGVTNGMGKIKAEMLDVASVADKALVDAFHGVEDAIVQLVTTGEVSFSKMIDSMVSDLARLAIRQAEASFFSSLFGLALPGHDQGASWTVGGSNGADTSLQAFWASPGETVTVTPSGASARQAPAGGGGAPSVVINNHSDPRALFSTAMRSPRGDVEVTNSMYRNRAVIGRVLR